MALQGARHWVALVRTGTVWQLCNDMEQDVVTPLTLAAPWNEWRVGWATYNRKVGL